MGGNRQESSIMCSGLNCYHLFPSTQNICCYNVAHFLCAPSPVGPSRLVVTSPEGPPFWVTPSLQLEPHAGTSSLSASGSTRRHPSPAMLRCQSAPRTPVILMERSRSLSKTELSGTCVQRLKIGGFRREILVSFQR